MAKISKPFQYGNQAVTLETGEIARQAGGAVMVSCDGTVVLCTAVAAKTQREGQDFFPLTVDYQEKFYAGGRIPGGFFKREGRATEKETLTSRLIDRPLRPLFPEEFKNEAVSYTHLDVYKRQRWYMPSCASTGWHRPACPMLR